MKARSMILALVACLVCGAALGTAGAQASTPRLGLAPVHAGAVKPASKAAKPKMYELCLEALGSSCYPMEVFTKTKTWNAPAICWIIEGEEGCIAPFDGTFVKGAKGEVTYLVDGPYYEDGAGEIIVYKVKKAKPSRYAGALYLFEGYDGLAEVII